MEFIFHFAYLHKNSSPWKQCLNDSMITFLKKLSKSAKIYLIKFDFDIWSTVFYDIDVIFALALQFSLKALLNEYKNIKFMWRKLLKNDNLTIEK